MKPKTDARSIHEWSTIRTELLWAYSGSVNPTDQAIRVNHNYGYWLWHIVKGEVEVRVDEEVKRAQAGEWLFCPTGETEQRFSSDAEILSLHFLCNWPTGENLFSSLAGLVFRADGYPQFTRAAKSLQRVVHKNFPGVRVVLFKQITELETFIELQQLFFKMLLEFTKILKAHGAQPAYAGSMDHRIGLAIRCLNEAPLSQPFPRKRLLQETGLSRVHLDRILSNQLGVTTKEYWEMLRKESASYQLESTEQSAKEIGYNLGFKQPSHFTTWFKNKQGMTPQEFRKNTSKRLIG